MRYATIDAQGLPNAFYSGDINKDIPKSAVPISEENWLKHLSGKSLCFDGITWKPYTRPSYISTAADLIRDLEASISQRNLRMAAVGDQFAIDKINIVESKISALRSQLV